MMHSPSSVLVLMTAALFLSVPALAAPENPPLPKEAGMDFGTAIQSCYPQPAGLNDAEQRFAHHLITGLWSGYCEEVELTMMDTKNMYESQRGGEPIMFLDTPEGREWVRRLADMTFTLNCLAGDGAEIPGCRRNLAQYFGFEPKVIARADVDDLLNRVCLNERFAEQNVNGALDDQAFAYMVKVLRHSSCGRQALQAFRRTYPTRPARRPEYHPKKPDSGGWFMVLDELKKAVPTYLLPSNGGDLERGRLERGVNRPVLGQPRFGL